MSETGNTGTSGPAPLAEPRAAFAGLSAVVTGGFQGLGRAIADALAARGATVHLFDWADTVPADLSATGPGALVAHRVDVSDAAATARAVAGLDPAPVLLVNNAGITRDRSLAKMSAGEWQAVIDVNLTGAFNMIQAVMPGMAAAGGGRIVNITSINGIRGKFGQANYAAAKAGLIGLTKTAARELGRKRVTVNAIAPGMVMTDMARALPAEILDKARAEAVLPDLATPEDIAAACLFLLSDDARAITGQVLQVDSGQYI
ncbi:MAG: 3-oxoacyl-ACP reductase FabG [Rhodobacterales bacterium]|nr:3-oxoacyl-ACP reductase FabG [Rhodobacterales bacterium]